MHRTDGVRDCDDKMDEYESQDEYIIRYEYESEDDFMLKSLGFFNTGEGKWNSGFVKEGLHMFILLALTGALIVLVCF